MRGPFEGLAEALIVLFYLACVGALAVLALLAWAVWFLVHHVRFA